MNQLFRHAPWPASGLPRTSTWASLAASMLEPLRYPGRIRTDPTNPFAHHTLEVRVPAIVLGVLDRGFDATPEVKESVRALAAELATGAALPPLDGSAPGAEEFRAALALRAGDGWLTTDWLFAETYAYRQLIERVRYWTDGRDPFLSNKQEEYASAAHASALERALGVAGPRDERLHELLGEALFGNRIDLSFAASLERGLVAKPDDLLIDERAAAVRLLSDGHGPIHVVADNAGTELTLDLVLCDALLAELDAEVVLHVKTHPTFVSDATARDVRAFLGVPAPGDAPETAVLRLRDGATSVRAFAERLRASFATGRLVIREHPFFTGPGALWEMPAELEAAFTGARLVIVKGDANYRRVVGDAVWPVETPFSDVTSYFPAPLFALRTLKSDPIAGLTRELAAKLDATDPTWRVNGQRGVACLGGKAARAYDGD
ncbi:MAG TPA: damage-control phosphatase ARMT1 family protein [Polyangiaceae bacterium]|nr:damage-control phosphatase ARMT1 family protein [Polyangiaceae bacterium]